MAHYHLRLKTNKSSKNKNVTGKNHTDYINREGKFKNIDEREILNEQTFIQKNEIKVNNTEEFGKIKKNLYVNVCGSIIFADNVLKITDKASDDTVQLALFLAIKLNKNNELDIHGDEIFKNQIVKAGAEIENDIIFNDRELNNKIKNMKEESNSDEKRISEYHRECRNRHRVSIADFKYTEKDEPFEFNSKEENILQDVSIWDMDIQQSDVGMLLSSDEANSMEFQETDQYIPMRRNVFRGNIIEKIKTLADEILSKNNRRTASASHADYINRDDIFAKKGGCVYKGNRLPKWANNSPRKFFEAADKYEQKRGIPYYEFELSLQQELTLEQNLEIINIFVNECSVLKDKYFAFAIHDKEAALDKTKQQIHCHLMFSPRMIDEHEKKNERAPEVFFSRAKYKNPQKGGCPKDRRFSMDNIKVRNETLLSIRKLWEKINNEIFKKYGINKKISHKSLKEQREDALKEKDYVKAEILNRAPEKYLGPDKCRDKSNPKVIDLLERRKSVKERNSLVKAVYMLETINKQDTLFANNKIAINKSNEVITKSNKQNNLPQEILALKDNVISLNAKLNDITKNVITYKQALERVRCNYMTSKEFEAYRHLKTIGNDVFTLRIKLKQSENIDEQNKIKETLECYVNVKYKYKEILKAANKRLLEPAMKAQITKDVNKILKENEPIRKECESVTLELLSSTNKLREAIINNFSTQKENVQVNKYTAVDVNKILANLLQDLRENISKTEKDLEFLKAKIIPKQRAKIMALDIATKGDYKKFRELVAEINKNKEQLIKINANIENLTKLIKSNTLTKENRPKYEEALNKNIKYKNDLETKIRNNELIVIKMKQQITNYITKPQSKVYINKIMQGILNKNLPIKKQFEQKLTMLSKMKGQLKETLSLKKAALKQIDIDKKGKKNISYAVKNQFVSSISSVGSGSAKINNNNINNARILANAFAGNVNMGNLAIKIIDDEYDEFRDNVAMNDADRLSQESTVLDL